MSTRFRAMADVFNASNAAGIANRNDAYGPTRGRPLAVQPGGVVKVGGQVDW